MPSFKQSKYVYFIYLAFLCAASFFVVPTLTSFYYYAWGKHLALSYFDGPPMIAYLFYLSRHIFGQTFFSINVIGLLCVVFGSIFISETGRLIGGRRVGWLAAMIWLVLPLTTQDVFTRVLYDAPLNLFTAALLYAFCKYCKTQQWRYLYLTAVCVGLMLLSKYTAVVSLMAVLVFLLASSHRRVFLSKHFYFASCVTILMLSPVVWWLAKHDWVSIGFLLSFHGKQGAHISSWRALNKIALEIVANYSYFLAVAVVGLVSDVKKRRLIGLDATPSLVAVPNSLMLITIVFWLVVTVFAVPRSNYLTPLGVSVALSSAYYIVQLDLKRSFWLFYGLMLVFCVALIATNSVWLTAYTRKGSMVSLVHDLQRGNLLNDRLPLATESYTSASFLGFFLRGRTVNSLLCSSDSDEFEYWSRSFVDGVKAQKVPEITYLDFDDTQRCALNYYRRCDLTAKLSQVIKAPSAQKKPRVQNLYVYHCQLPR
jgi:4-amino-4-deoxy-L-arabinose transferase-like glycosyltransferase